MKNLVGIRLLFLGTYPPPFGGIASHLNTLLPDLVKLGLEQSFVLHFDQKSSIEEHKGFVVHRKNLSENFWKIIYPPNLPLVMMSIFVFLRGNMSLKGAIKETIKVVLINELVRLKKIDIISSYISVKSLPLVILDKYWFKKKGIILTVFGEVYDSSDYVDKHKKLLKKLFDLPEFVLASSNHCGSSFKKIGIKREIETLFYGVDIDQKEGSDNRIKFRSENSFDKNDVIFLFFGRMNEDMGLDVLLSIIPDVLQRHDNAKFIIAGASGTLTVEAQEVASNSFGKVVVFENVPFKRLPEIYGSSDILLAPSFNQRACMGVSIKEAMAASLPVIASKGGGISEAVVNDLTGYLIPLDDSGRTDTNDLIMKMSILLQDPEKRIKFGREGRKRAEKLFSVEGTNERFAEIILMTAKSHNIK